MILLVLILIAIGVTSLFTSDILVLDTSQLQDVMELEITFPVPITTYKIDSSCELAEHYRDIRANWKTNDEETIKYFSQYQKETKALFIKALVETWNVQYGELYGDIYEKDFDSDKVGFGNSGYYYLDYSLLDKFGAVGLNWKNLDQFYSLVNGKHGLLKADSYMKKYSIDPAFRVNVINVQSSYVQYLLEPHKYAEDISCGKRYHEKYANETFAELERLQSSKFANQIHGEIRQILYS